LSDFSVKTLPNQFFRVIIETMFKQLTIKSPIKPMLCMLLGGLILLSSSSSLLAADRGLYRWVDDQGVVHYGDHVPARYSKRERQVLNSQAVVIDTLAAEKTKEQLALEAQERARQAELRRIATEKAHKDRVLLATYSEPEDIDRALVSAQDKIDSRINVVNINIDNLQKQRSNILDRITYFADNRSDDSEGTVVKLEEQLGETNDELSNAISLRNNLTSERKSLATVYQGDKERFIKLRLQREEATMAQNHPLL